MRRTLRFLCFALVAFVLPCFAQSAPAPFIAPHLSNGYIPIDGPWQFHPGDNPQWASPAFDDSTWPRIETGRDWESQGFRNLTGFAWYRRRITLPDQLSDPGWQLALVLPGVQDAAEIYWNGNLVGSYGKLPPNPVWYGGDGDTTASPHFPTSVPLGRPASGVLAIRLWKAPYVYYSFPDEGGLKATPLLGSAHALADRDRAVWYTWLRSNLWQLGLGLLAGIVSLLALLAWLRHRRQPMLLWLALYSIHPLALLPYIGIPGLLSFRWAYGTVAPIIGLEDISLWFLLLYLLGLRDNPRLVRWTWIMTAIAIVGSFGDGALQLFNWTTWPDHLFLTLDVGFTIPSELVEAWAIVLVVFAFRRRLDASRWFLGLAAMLADVVQAFINWFSLGFRWTHWTLSQPFQEPLFSVAGNQFDPLSLCNTLLLVAIVYAVWRQQTEQSRRQTRIDEELRNAREVQRLLVPESVPSLRGLSIGSVYKPASEVGGDFFQVIPLHDGAALIVVGDVSGKGLRAAMTVSLIIGALRTLVESPLAPHQVLSALNRRLHEHLRGGFATCLLLRVDPAGTCLVANAGHIPPYLNGREIPIPGDLPLGLVPDAEYQESAFTLAAGDCLTLLTDGVLEAQNADGELFGFDRTRAVATQSAEAIAHAAQQFGQEDDITVLTLRFAPADRPSENGAKFQSRSMSPVGE